MACSPASCAGPTAGGDSIASARTSRKRASLWGVWDDEKAADPPRDRLGACRRGGRRLVYFADRNSDVQPGRAARPFCGRCGDAGRPRHRRQGRYSGGGPRLGNGDADQHRQRQDPDHRPAHQGRVQGRPDGQAGRPAGRGRSAALRRRASAGGRHDAEGRGAAEERPDRPGALQEAGRPGLDRPAAIRHPDLPRPPVRSGAGDRPGPGRRRQAQRHLHQDPGAADRPHRPAFGRPGQLRDDGRRHQHLHHHPGAADLGDLHHSRRLAAPGPRSA